MKTVPAERVSNEKLAIIIPIGIKTWTHVREILNTRPCMFSGTCVVNHTRVGVFRSAIKLPVTKLKMIIKIEKINFE